MPSIDQRAHALLGSTAHGGLVTLAGSQTISGTKRFSATQEIANNAVLRWIDSGGTTRNIIFLNSSDTLKIGNVAFSCPIDIETGGGSILLRTNNVTRITVGSVTTLADGLQLAVGTTTGTKIGTATSQKLGFFNATPVVQPASTPVAAATQTAGYVQADVQSIATLVNDLRAKLLSLGLIA
jgi:hypothetical protein